MKRRSLRTKVNTKLITDVGLAGVGVRVLPMVLAKFVPLDSQMIYTVAGAGATYALGSALKKPDMANSAIALGLVEIIAPMIEDMMSGFVGGAPVAQLPSGLPMPPKKEAEIALNGYGRLNDYIPLPEKSNYWDYKGAY